MATTTEEKWKKKAKKKPKLYCKSKTSCPFKVLTKTVVEGEYEVLCRVTTHTTCEHRTSVPQKIKL